MSKPNFNKLSYPKLMALDPFIYEQIVNSIGQKIVFAEHPTRGDEHPVICICHELQFASASDFYELDDMTAEHGEYEPYFTPDGNLEYGRH